MNHTSLLASFYGRDPVYGDVVGALDGIPVMSRHGVPQLTRDEAESLPVQAKYAGKMFCLWKPDDLAEYLGIMEMVTNDTFQVRVRRELQVDADLLPDRDEPGPGLKVWLEWVQYFKDGAAAGRSAAFDPLGPLPGGF